MPKYVCEVVVTTDEKVRFKALKNWIEASLPILPHLYSSVDKNKRQGVISHATKVRVRSIDEEIKT